MIFERLLKDCYTSNKLFLKEFKTIVERMLNDC